MERIPAELTSFVGRRQELGDLKSLLAAYRMVTLTGVGGAGKTRLVLQVATSVRRAFRDGVWLVDLARLQCPGASGHDVENRDMLACLMMAALGVRQDAGSPVRQLIAHLAGRRTLLVLDNCEHLLPACRVLVDELLRGCPGLRVLATSRESVGIGGEVPYPVPPLPIPGPSRRPGLAELSLYDSVALFVARAQAAGGGFALTEENQEAVAELCRRLDGLPLAIELAAARVRVLAPGQILDRLTDRFGLLSNGSRNAPDRQQTLRGCVDWSFGLCSKPEQRLWARLSGFPGDFELDAVEGICAGEDLPVEDLPVEDLVDLVAGLVDKSILERAGADGGRPRYRLLETIRAYGQERLVEVGEQAIVSRRHRDWYQRLVAQANAECTSHRQAYWYARLARERPNLRAAIEFSLTEPDQAEFALRIVLDLPRAFWCSHDVVSEGVSWLDRALLRAVAPTALRARALMLAAALALFRGEAGTMTGLLEHGVRLARRLDDRHAFVLAAYVRAHAALWGNDLTGALTAAEQGLTELSCAPTPDVTMRLQLLFTIVQAAALTGEHGRAGRAYHEILHITEVRGETSCRSYAMWAYALVAWRENQVWKAGRQACEGLRLRRAAGLRDPRHAALSVELLAWVTACQRRHRRAAVLLGAADALWTIRGSRITAEQMLIADHDGCERQVREALGDAAFAEAFRDGQALPFEEAVGYALDQRQESRPAPAPPATRDASAPLTRREQQIAGLLADGLSNRQIAGALVISQRTAESHVEHILAKLGFTGRAEVATWIVAYRAHA